MDSPPPRLAISCSSPAAERRVRRAAEEIFARMPAELAESLAATCMVFGLDHHAHAAFVQGFPDSGVAQVGAERARQRARRGQLGGDLAVIVLCLNEYTPVSRIIAHEFGHIVLGHTDTLAVAALSPEQLDERERAAEAFADQYAPWSA